MLERLVELRERRLVGAHRVRGDHLLLRRAMRSRAGAVRRAHADVPARAASASTGAVTVPADLARLARRELDRLARLSRRRRGDRRALGREPRGNVERRAALGGVAHGERRAERSPSRTSGGRPDSSIRSCVERIERLAGAEQAGAGVRDRDDPEARSANR